MLDTLAQEINLSAQCYNYVLRIYSYRATGENKDLCTEQATKRKTAMPSDKLPGDWFLDALSRGGVDLGELESRLPFETTQVRRAPDDTPPTMINTILLESEKLSGDVHIGLRLIDLVPVADYGAYGYLLTNAPSVGAMLRMAQRYYPTFYRGAVVRLQVGRLNSTFEYVVDAPARHDTEWSLGFFVRLIKEKVGTGWVPEKTTFTFHEPDRISELGGLFGGDILFGHTKNSFRIHTSMLEQEIIGVDSNLLAVIVAYADMLLADVTKSVSFESQVKLLILEHLEQGTANSERVAKLLHISRSTLKRRLMKEGHSFRQLRDEIVRQLSQDALKQTDAQVSEIALKLGYSELSAFDRAFGRLTGMSPLEFRRFGRTS
ncbi:MAG: AraC-like DNA-binding protein [Candidatus Krumholzibacteriia bacterium]